MNNSIFFLILKLRFSDIDAANIAYFARYPSFFDESFIYAMRKENIDWSEKENVGFLIPIVEQKTNYFNPLKMGDTAKIYMIIMYIGNKSFRSEHLITLQNPNGTEKLIAKGYMVRVTVSVDNFVPIKIPNIMRSALQKYYLNDSHWNKFESNLTKN